MSMGFRCINKEDKRRSYFLLISLFLFSGSSLSAQNTLPQRLLSAYKELYAQTALIPYTATYTQLIQGIYPIFEPHTQLKMGIPIWDSLEKENDIILSTTGGNIAIYIANSQKLYQFERRENAIYQVVSLEGEVNQQIRTYWLQLILNDYPIFSPEVYLITYIKRTLSGEWEIKTQLFPTLISQIDSLSFERIKVVHHYVETLFNEDSIMKSKVLYKSGYTPQILKIEMQQEVLAYRGDYVCPDDTFAERTALSKLFEQGTLHKRAYMSKLKEISPSISSTLQLYLHQFHPSLAYIHCELLNNFAREKPFGEATHGHTNYHFFFIFEKNSTKIRCVNYERITNG